MAISTIGQNGLTVPLTSNTITSASATALTLQSAGTTAVTINTSQQVGVNTTVPSARLAANTPSRNDGLTNTLGAIVAAGPISDSPSYLFSASTAIFRVQGTDATNNLQFGIGSSGYNYNPWIQGSYDNGSPGSPNNGAKDIVMQPLGGSVLVGTGSSAFNSGIGVKLGLDTTGPAVVCVGSATTASYNSYFIYSTGAGANRFYVSYAGQINATSTSINGISDISLKENIRDLETGLAEVMALRPRRFDWKEETKLDHKNVAGFVAQEVEPILPDLVYEYQYNEETTKKSLKMGDMLPTLVKAIQELKAINDQQAETINALTARIEALENK